MSKKETAYLERHVVYGNKVKSYSYTRLGNRASVNLFIFLNGYIKEGVRLWGGSDPRTVLTHLVKYLESEVSISPSITILKSNPQEWH